MLAPFPRTNPLTHQSMLHPRHWVEWFQNLFDTVNACPERLQRVTKIAHGASIGATAIPLQTINEGLYRVSWYARITRAGSVSSSLTVTIGFLHATVACSFSGAAMTGNTTATVQSGSVLLFSDKDGPITYAAAYLDGGGATSMQYYLQVVIERMS
jgi:hypothetical protein